MAFSLLVEMLNLRMKKGQKEAPVALKHNYPVEPEEAKP